MFNNRFRLYVYRGVISALKDKLPNKDHKKIVFEILNDTKKEYGRYNNCGTKVL